MDWSVGLTIIANMKEDHHTVLGRVGWALPAEIEIDIEQTSSGEGPKPNYLIVDIGEMVMLRR